MITRCAAKIKLRLRVMTRDESGYHAVETLFARTDLADGLEIRDTETGISLEVDGPEAAGVITGFFPAAAEGRPRLTAILPGGVDNRALRLPALAGMAILTLGPLAAASGF